METISQSSHSALHCLTTQQPAQRRTIFRGWLFVLAVLLPVSVFGQAGNVNHAPVALVNLSPLFAITPNDTNLFILSSNNSNAAVVLDGSQSSDVDQDPLQFFWNADGQTNALASSVLATNRLAVGPHTVTLVVNDGLDTGTAQVSFEIITPGMAVGQLARLVEEASLELPNKRLLLATLAAATESFDRGHMKMGLHRLASFQHQVRTQVAPLNATLAESFLLVSRKIIQVVRDVPRCLSETVQVNGVGVTNIAYFAAGFFDPVGGEYAGHISLWDSRGIRSVTIQPFFNVYDAQGELISTPPMYMAVPIRGSDTWGWNVVTPGGTASLPVETWISDQMLEIPDPAVLGADLYDDMSPLYNYYYRQEHINESQTWRYGFSVISYEPDPEHVFDYVANDGTIIITGYTGPGGDVTIPDIIDCLHVTGIANGAFANCDSLTRVKIPNSVASIGDAAFANCPSLTKVRIPGNVTNIGYEAFSFCTSLTAIAVDPQNSFYSSLDGVLFNKDQTTLIQYPGGKPGSYTIPESVTGIGNSAFESCSSLTSLNIPDSVTSIGFYAFFFSFSLTNVTIGNGVSSIREETFSLCSGLTSVTIGNSVTSIDFGAFQGCTSLTGVYFRSNAPSSVGDYVFYRADNATVFYLPGTTGWGGTLAGLPTALWKPLIASNDPSFGVQTNQFGFNVDWASGQVVVVEACTNLVNPAWVPVRTNTLTSDSFYFSDPEWTNHPCRFYRVRSP